MGRMGGKSFDRLSRFESMSIRMRHTGSIIFAITSRGLLLARLAVGDKCSQAVRPFVRPSLRVFMLPNL